MTFNFSFKQLFLLVFLCSLLLNAGYFILGGDAYVLIHDNLDSELTYLELMKRSGTLLTFWSNPMVEGVMEGIPRAAFRTPLNVTVLLYNFLPPFWTYALNKVLVHSIAFLGMYLLLQEHIVAGRKKVALSCAFLFSLLSYYHIQYGISIAGQPLLLWAFLDIAKRRQRLASWLVILLFPFYSFMAATLPFFVPFLVGIGAWFFYKKRQVNINYLVALGLYISASVFAEFPLFYSSVFSPEFVSHRVAWNPFLAGGGYPTLPENLRDMVLSTLVTPYHAGSMLTFPIGAAVLVLLIRCRRLSLLQGVLISCIAGIVLWACLNDWLILGLMDRLTLLKIFNIDRVNFLLPMLWLLLLATVFVEIDQTKSRARTAVVLLFIATLAGTTWYDAELRNNSKLLVGMQIEDPTFNQFFATDLFAEIKKAIPLPPDKYKVVTLGAFPNIAVYNGLPTLDSYQNNYPLAYKHKFRQLIAGELAKNDTLQNYFDFWGSRCYFLSAELALHFQVPKESPVQVHDLAFDAEQFSRMNGRYVISAVPLKESTTIGLTHVDTFENEGSYWRFFLYKAEPKLYPSLK